MTIYISRFFKHLGAAAILKASFLALTTPSFVSLAAAQNSEGRQFSAESGELVNTVLTFINSHQHAAALAKLAEALSLPALNAYERGTIYQMKGASHYALNQYGPAITAFDNAVSSGGLLPKEVDRLRVNIAQLMIADEQYAKGAQALEDYLKAGGPEKAQYVEFLVQAWLQAENYARAEPWAEQWFEDANPKERKHFDSLNLIYYKLNQAGPQAAIVEQMVKKWPEDRALWDAWISLLTHSGQEEEAFAVNVMLYERGALKQEEEILKLVQYYSYYGIPFQAANILEQEMNVGRVKQSSERFVQLADLFRQAREYERAIPILEKAVSLSQDGATYAKLGEALYNQGACEGAETAFKQAVDRGFNVGKAWMLIGTCRYEGAQIEARPVCKDTTKEERTQTPFARKRVSALSAFKNVPLSSSESKSAKKWVQFIRQEALAIEDRCDFEASLVRDRCFNQIKQAYDAGIFTDGFKLEDQNCLKFKAEYDAIYRVKIGGEG